VSYLSEPAEAATRHHDSAIVQPLKPVCVGEGIFAGRGVRRERGSAFRVGADDPRPSSRPSPATTARSASMPLIFSPNGPMPSHPPAPRAGPRHLPRRRCSLDSLVGVG
jgi:hypothetical protein